MEHQPNLDHPTHGRVHANVVLAALALLTDTPIHGVVRANSPGKIETTAERLALLEAATAIQTEVSLSIVSSDPLIFHASHQLEESRANSSKSVIDTDNVEATDRTLHGWISLLEGRGDEINAIADSVIEHGEMAVAEIAKRLCLKGYS